MVVIEVDEICRKLKPVLGEQIDRLWSMYQAEKPQGRKWIHITLLNLLQKHLNQTYEQKKVLLTPPPKDMCLCDYPIGRICYRGKSASDYCLNLWWSQNAGVNALSYADG